MVKNSRNPWRLAALLVCLLSLLFVFILPRVSADEDIPYAWTDIDRVVAVADLHGDYGRFIFILAHPQIALIDQNLHWTGGKAHLVQLGDILDRGPDARKIFGFLMRLEKEAEAAGGMVHTLLGNHEEMNITGIALDYPGYVTPEQFVSFLPEEHRRALEAEYIKSLSPEKRRRVEIEGLDIETDENVRAYWQRVLDRKDPKDQRAYVLGFNAAVGDWLLRKNAVIKIDGIVFVHGGISEDISKWPLREINTVMRSELEYFQAVMRSPQRVTRAFKPKLVYNSDGPLWFRGLAEKKNIQAEVDRILANLDAKAMVIGHNYFDYRGGSSSVITKELVSRFQDKVWIMDTGISGTSYGGVPSALIYDHGEFNVWGETEEVAARSGVKLPALQPMTRREIEMFLRTAPITGRGPGPGGRTDAWKLTLEAQGVELQALFKYIDRRRPDPLADSYRYELAAFALDKYLDTGIVPPIVERTVENVPGGLQLFVADAVSEAERKAQNIAPVDPEAHEKAIADLLVFQNLAYDDCHNERDTLVVRDTGRVYRVDFSEAFAPVKNLLPDCSIRRCSRLLYKKLQGWDDKTASDYLGRFLDPSETAALNARRRQVVRAIEMQIKMAGERNVLF
jgi:hypothetical protein